MAVKKPKPSRMRQNLGYASEALLFACLRVAFSAMTADAASRSAYRFGRLIAPVLTDLKVAERNIEIGMPELKQEARTRLARVNAGNLARTLIEYLHVNTLLREPNRLRIEGAEHVEKAVADESGAVYATAHFGNPEVCRIAVQRFGEAPALVYRPPNNHFLRATIAQIVRQVEAPVFASTTARRRDLRQFVGGGKSVLILADQRPIKGPRIPFMTRPARTHTGPASLSRHAGAPLIPVRAKRLEGSSLSFEVRFESPIKTGRSLEMMESLNARIGEWVLEAPEQWLWLHERWR